MRAPHEATRDVVKQAGEPIAVALYEAFGRFNRDHFGRRLAAPLVLITQTSARSLGDYISQDVHGLQSRIRIAPRAVKRGEAFALDVLLHEMIHAWQEEIDHEPENGYRGHGPRFAAKANEIGQKLGLPPVSAKGAGGLPDCKYWPMNLRPEGYYEVPFAKPKNPNENRGQGEEGEGEEPGESETVATVAKAHALIDKLCALVPELSASDDGIDVVCERLHLLLGDLGAEMGEAAE